MEPKDRGRAVRDDARRTSGARIEAGDAPRAPARRAVVRRGGGIALALALAACTRGGPTRHAAAHAPLTPPSAQGAASATHAANEAGVRRLIDALATISEEGMGYSGAYAGSDFLPYADASQPGMVLLGRPAPAPSGALRSLVELGAPAVPALVACLADARPTRLAPVQGLEWTGFADEYDINRRTDAEPPAGAIASGDAGIPRTVPYQVTVGDLCFVALGQIVNRAFNAVRYQASGGMVISSPSRSPALRQLVEAGLRGFSAERHRAGLVRDFREPDGPVRREGAALRLAFYFPEYLETRELARTLRLLTHDASPRIDAAALELTTTTRSADVALACMARLAGRGHDAELRQVAERFLRAALGSEQQAAFRAVLAAGAGRADPGSAVH